MPTSPIRISICIGSDVFARGLYELLKEKQAQMGLDRVQLSLDPPEQLIHRLAKDVDLLILDQIHCDVVAPHLNELRCSPRVVLVSEQRHPGVRRCELLKRGCGFFPARVQQDQLVNLFEVVLNCTRSPGENPCCRRCPLAISRQPEPLSLTDREKEVLILIGQLKGNSEIAESLGVSPKTVETHCANIKLKLDLSNSKQLLKAAIDWVEGR